MGDAAVNIIFKEHREKMNNLQRQNRDNHHNVRYEEREHHFGVHPFSFLLGIGESIKTQQQSDEGRGQELEHGHAQRDHVEYIDYAVLQDEGQRDDILRETGKGQCDQRGSGEMDSHCDHGQNRKIQSPPPFRSEMLNFGGIVTQKDIDHFSDIEGSNDSDDPIKEECDSAECH